MKLVDYAYIETTNYCNLDCSFCNRDEVIGPLQHMTTFNFESIMVKLKDHPIKEAKLMGMGEPFLHPQFDEICRKFKQYFPKAKLISSTNCQYRVNSVFTNSLKYIDYLYLSIDGYKVNYETYRSPSKWKKLIEFLNTLNKLDKQNCKIAVNYVVNPKNVFDIQKVYDEIVKGYHLDELRLNIAQEWNPDKSIPLGYTEYQFDYLKENWSTMIKGKSIWEYKDCFWPQRGVYITVEGRVLMCCMNTAAKSFGNIFSSSLDTIRNTIGFKKVVEGCKENNPTDHCKNCSYHELVPILKRIGINE